MSTKAENTMTFSIEDNDNTAKAVAVLPRDGESGPGILQIQMEVDIPAELCADRDLLQKVVKFALDYGLARTAFVVNVQRF